MQIKFKDPSNNKKSAGHYMFLTLGLLNIGLIETLDW